ncbi:Sterol desaturase/sphingolipid hydroxylase, fatty acid hydroxylase superfamily [Sphingomonas sp. YR710]|uniref:sterol desaturase family protein n=1 Tax=Sphingomonas sp. YR710 TaxID=1882773 RepID=UPI00088D6DAB|nr:sterol desaturase family protein [Sphingomonas sp. YR710]SDD28889.1 Sterol desaturase/sphingolipid hydroxylase, fatty acid hydroxylase superfamily [Sphingomonas sp. YR710]
MMSHQLLLFLGYTARLSVWLIILAAIFVPLERLFALRPLPILRPGLLEDLGLYFLNGLVAAFLLGVPLAFVAAIAVNIIPEAYYSQVDMLPLWAKLGAIFAIGECGFYWGHRWSHEWAWLWHFHSIHHQPNALDWLVNTRAHPIDIIFTRLCGLVPVYVLGLARPGAASDNIGPLLLTLGGTVWSFFIHANLRWRLGWIEQVISSPRFHHWHHSREINVNRNYAPMLPVYDRIFGSFYLPATAWPQHYGIRSASILATAPSPPLPGDIQTLPPQ